MIKKLLPQICFCILLLSSCTSNSILFVVDHYWYSSGYFSATDVKKMENTARSLGAKMSILPIGTTESISAHILSGTEYQDTDFILLSPFFNNQIDTITAELPDMTICLLSFGQGPAGDRNYTQVEFSRETAFEELGSELCAYMNGSAKGKIKGIWFTGAADLLREYEAFFRGFSSDCGLDRLDISQISAINDEMEVKDYVKNFEGGEGDIGVAFVSTLNEYCINKYMDIGIGFASEYILPETYSGNGPVLSVKYPIEKVIEAILTENPERGDSIKVDAVLLKRK